MHSLMNVEHAKARHADRERELAAGHGHRSGGAPPPGARRRPARRHAARVLAVLAARVDREAARRAIA